VGGSECAVPFVEPEAWGFSEGMSDYFALTILSYLGRQRGVATPLRVFGEAFQPGGLRDYTHFQAGLAPGETDSYRIGKVWCAAMLSARESVVIVSGGREDLSERFVWQASIDAFKAMAPLCKDSLELTLVHAKDAVVSAAAAIETKFGLAGASVEMRKAFAQRGI
jgi:hypothetical protein